MPATTGGRATRSTAPRDLDRIHALPVKMFDLDSLFIYSFWGEGGGGTCCFWPCARTWKPCFGWFPNMFLSGRKHMCLAFVLHGLGSHKVSHLQRDQQEQSCSCSSLDLVSPCVRFWSMFPLTRVPFWYRFFEPRSRHLFWVSHRGGGPL